MNFPVTISEEESKTIDFGLWNETYNAYFFYIEKLEKINNRKIRSKSVFSNERRDIIAGLKKDFDQIGYFGNISNAELRHLLGKLRFQQKLIIQPK